MVKSESKTFIPYENMFSKGKILNLPDGSSMLTRTPLVYKPDPNDRVHLVVSGDKIVDIAYKYYSNPNFWYLIADANNLQKVYDLEVGSELIIPDLQIALENR